MKIMSFILLAFCMTASLMAEEVSGKDQEINKQMLKKMVESYRQILHEKTQSVKTLSPEDLAIKMKNEEDRKLFLQLAEETGLKRFAPAILKGDTYYIELPFGHKAYFSALDVVENRIFINDKPFTIPEGASYKELVQKMRVFLMPNSRRSTFLDTFITPAYAFFTAQISDIIVAHTSGYISINYDDADIVHGENHYAKIFHDSLTSEIAKAKKECVQVQSDVGESRYNFLSDGVKKVIDSMKFEDSNYNDYAIISGLMKKYAGKVTKAKSPYVKKEASGLGEVGKMMNVNDRYENMFGDKCELFVKVMLPQAYMPGTVNTFKTYQQNICKGINDLKGCYKQMDELHAKTDNDRRRGLKNSSVGELRILESVPQSSQSK